MPTHNMRELLDILVESASMLMYLSKDKAQSVSLADLDSHDAQLLLDNPNTVGRFQFKDESGQFFWRNGNVMPFRDAAKYAADQYSRERDTRFARLWAVDITA